MMAHATRNSVQQQSQSACIQRQGAPRRRVSVSVLAPARHLSVTGRCAPNSAHISGPLPSCLPSVCRGSIAAGSPPPLHLPT